MPDILALPNPRPTATRGEALARLADLAALDTDRVGETTRSQLFEPDGEAIATVVIWHGFTNAPSQFVAVAKEFANQGLRVLVPRMPRHGYLDVLNHDLAGLTEAELVEQIDTCIDIAAGFGAPVWVLGLSGGGVLAAWAAVARTEIARAVLVAPLVAPKGFPQPLVRALVRFPALVPGFYYWWDPRLKEKMPRSPHAYPGFPIPGIMPFLRLTWAMRSHALRPSHQLTRVVLVSNPGDFAIRRDAAREFAAEVFAQASDYYGEATVDAGLGWWHDFIDPWAQHGGTTEQVVPLLLAALGVAEPSAGGTLVPPLVQPQPA